MARGKYSTVERAHRGCLSGCLVRLLVLLGVLALAFVVACMTGILSNDTETGAPVISFKEIHAPDISHFALDLEAGKQTLETWLEGVNLKWKFKVNGSGLTVKVLRAGNGESILVCADGYTMIVDAGSGGGNWISAQMLLGGVRHLNMAVAASSDDTNIGGMKTMISRYKPAYLLYQDSQIKGTAYNQMMDAAGKVASLQRIPVARGLSFQLGRASVTAVGPMSTSHSNSLDDGLSLRIDYGQRRVLLLGTITGTGAQDLATWGNPEEIRADVLIAGNGGAGLTRQLLETVRPRTVYVAGVPDLAAISVARTAGFTVVTLKEKGILSVYTDGTELTLEP